MAKSVWKTLVPLGRNGGSVTTSRLLPHVAWDPKGLIVWFETPQEDPAPMVHHLHVVLTGDMFPDSWEWIASVRHERTGFVGHLYRSAIDPY